MVFTQKCEHGIVWVRCSECQARRAHLTFGHLTPRPPDRIARVIAKLQTRWELNPDLRLGQLLENLTAVGEDLFYVEDDEMERRLESGDGW